MDAEKKSIELTYDKAVELLDRAVEEKGEDYVYKPLRTHSWVGAECAYFHDQRPGCIVGHVLAYAGLEPSDLTDRKNTWGHRGDLNTGAGPDRLREYGVLRADPLTINLLAKAQQKQDEGQSWIDAVESAKEAYAA